MLSLQIVHGHFPVTDGEQLVAFGPVSLTVTTEGITPQAQQFIKPTSWRFDSIHEKITAYEFTYDPENRLLDTPQDFLTEMFSLMKRLGLTEILGIVQFISDDPLLYLEESRGRAKISLPQKVFSQHEGYLEVVWSLAPKNVGQCKTKCSFRGPLRPHQPIHVFS